jgi:predicted  nucleic acid-binding Zn-ribbon protein
MNSTNQQPIEELQKRYKKLYDEKIRVETELKAAQEQLCYHKENAKKIWGTDDVHELEKRLQAIKNQNEQKRGDYQKHLDSIELQLNNIKANNAGEEKVDDINF